MGRLITEADVKSGRAGDPIVIDGDTLITPSALDQARLLGIEVRYRRGDQPPSGGDRQTPTNPPDWPDGRYLVTVTEGRWLVHRLEDDGPRPVDPLRGGPCKG